MPLPRGLITNRTAVLPGDYQRQPPVVHPQAPETPRTPRTRRPVGERRGRMNGWETRYADHLRLLQAAGEVTWFAFEVIRVRLADGAWYCPDFAVIYADGRFELHEVKGRWREAAMLRVKVARDRYPWIRFRAVRLVRGEWCEV